MVVFSLENAPRRLRGILSRWCVEARAGLFVGRLDARMRDLLWEKITDLAVHNTSAVLIWREPTEQGYAFRTFGTGHREPVLIDGIWLVTQQERTPNSSLCHQLRNGMFEGRNRSFGANF